MAELSTGSNRQNEIYAAGSKPLQPVSVEQLQQRAKQVLSPEAYDYIAGSAGSEDSYNENLSSFRRWRIVPRFLRDVSQRDTSVRVLDQHFSGPIMLAPIGVQSILHPAAERAVAQAARALNVPMILSTLSSTPLEEVAQILGDTPRWFQLYWPKHEAMTASLLQRAEASGYSALVVTLDTYYLSWRERDLANAYLPFQLGHGLANYVTDPVFRGILGVNPDEHPDEVFRCFGQLFSNAALTWESLSFLQRHTRLPILLKGVLHPDDAKKAEDHGVAGVIVSNHGGRQLDGAIAALDALPQVVDAVGDRLTVLFDSGIRRGADVVKALALGAKAILLGRPYGYGLAVNGEQGVRDVVHNLFADFDLTLALAGCRNCSELTRDLLCKQ